MTTETHLPAQDATPARSEEPDTTLRHRLVRKLNPFLIWSDVAVFLALATVVFSLTPVSARWYAGLALAIAGFVLWMVARRQLGKSFMAGAAARQYVGTGLYRRFKHPIYYSGFLGHFGIFLALGNWWLLAVWFAYASIIQFARMKREDKVLEQAFGEEFRRVRQGTWF